MEKCKDCELLPHDCICNAVDQFFKENKHLMQDLAEIEAKEKAAGTMCHACYFVECRCSEGLGKQ